MKVFFLYIKRFLRLDSKILQDTSGYFMNTPVWFRRICFICVYKEYSIMSLI